MIIADIIKELENNSADQLIAAIKGNRATYEVLPATLQKEMLSEYSNIEYALQSALNAVAADRVEGEDIFTIYTDNKQ